MTYQMARLPMALSKTRVTFAVLNLCNTSTYNSGKIAFQLQCVYT